MMIREHHCAHARPSSGTMSPPFVLCFRHTSRRCRRWAHGTSGARSPDGRQTCLYVLVVRYIYDSSVQALDSRRARRTTRPSRRRPKSQHAVGSKFAFERPVGGSLLDSSRMRLLESYRPLACWPQGWEITGLPRSGTGLLRLAHCRTDSSPGTRRDQKKSRFHMDF